MQFTWLSARCADEFRGMRLGTSWEVGGCRIYYFHRIRGAFLKVQGLHERSFREKLRQLTISLLRQALLSPQHEIAFSSFSTSDGEPIYLTQTNLRHPQSTPSSLSSKKNSLIPSVAQPAWIRPLNEKPLRAPCTRRGLNLYYEKNLEGYLAISFSFIFISFSFITIWIFFHSASALVIKEAVSWENFFPIDASLFR